MPIHSYTVDARLVVDVVPVPFLRKDFWLVDVRLALAVGLATFLYRIPWLGDVTAGNSSYACPIFY
jgi:hypothetical protein